MKNMAYAERVSLGEMEKRLPPQFVRCHKYRVRGFYSWKSDLHGGWNADCGRTKISGRCKKRTACVCTEIGWNTCPEIT